MMQREENARMITFEQDDEEENMSESVILESRSPESSSYDNLSSCEEGEESWRITSENIDIVLSDALPL